MAAELANKTETILKDNHGVDFILMFGFRFPLLADKILNYIYPSKLEDYRLVSHFWNDYITYLIKKYVPDGSVWVETNRKINVQQTFSFPAPHIAQDLIYDAARNMAVIFHTTTCYQSEIHCHATLFHDFMTNKQEAKVFFYPEWTNMREENHPVPCTLSRKIDQAKELENPLQAYHQTRCIFLKDYFVYLADDGRDVRCFNVQTKNYILLTTDDPMPSWYYTNINKLENKENGILCHGLVKTLDQERNVIQLRLVIVSKRHVSGDSVEKAEQRIPGPFLDGTDFGIGLQILDNIGVLTTGLGTGYVFKVSQTTAKRVKLVKVRFIYALNTKEDLPITTLKFVVWCNYIVVTGTVNTDQGKLLEIIRCYECNTGKTVWEKVYKQEQINNVYKTGDYVFWTTTDSLGNNNQVHGWNCRTDSQLNAIKVEIGRGKARMIKFDSKPWVDLTHNSFLVPTIVYRANGIESYEYGRNRIGYSLYLLSVKNNKMQIIKSINIGLHYSWVVHPDIRFFTDKSRAILYMVDTMTWRACHPGSRIVSFSLKNDNVGIKLKPSLELAKKYKKMLHITFAEMD